MRKVEIKFSGERITQARVLEDGSCELVVEIVVNEGESEVVENMEQSESLQELDENVFVLVEASKLSLDDKFMKHNPTTAKEKEFKELLTKVIRKGIKDFYRPKYDPSFYGDGTDVTFKAGNKPAVGKFYNWWKKVAKEFMPERRSRLGTKSEYVAFLGVLIKKLVEDEKWSVAKAWDAVCNNSKELGHYLNSEDAKHRFEDTGMREICGFFDLANAYKILAEDEDDCTGGFWLAGGGYNTGGRYHSLADLCRGAFLNFDGFDSVGWFVLS
jgi:hypothetical protein